MTSFLSVASCVSTGNDGTHFDPKNPHDVQLLSTGPRLDPSECIGAIASNGRVFYTGHGGGLQISLAPAADQPAAKTSDGNASK
jgi:hypothetical protein